MIVGGFREINWFVKIILFVTLTSIRCSLVRDYANDIVKYASEYCPKTKYCPEGSHVMCNMYDPNRKMGPACTGVQKAKLTVELVNRILDVVNKMRSKIAMGRETGKGGKMLPQGYGIFRLKWDRELSRFAQVLANQCIRETDMCRATKKFPDPGQIGLEIRFTVNDWMPVSNLSYFKNTGFDDERTEYAVNQALKVIIKGKEEATVDSITNFGSANSSYKWFYEKTIYGPSTHMGCGISAYKNHMYQSLKYYSQVNIIFLVCNFSAQPRKSTSVYNTVPPSDTESSFNSCGCPMGSFQDHDCLCHEVSLEKEPKSKPCPQGDGDCDPTVVVLPIFTVENAPPDKLVIKEHEKEKYFTSTTTSADQIPEDTENVIVSSKDMFGNNPSVDDKEIYRKSRKTLDLSHGNSFGIKQSSLALHANAVTVRSRYFDKPIQMMEHKDSNISDKKRTQKSSVFSKTPIFELPGSHSLMPQVITPRKNIYNGKNIIDQIYNDNTYNDDFQHGEENEANNINGIKSLEIHSDLHSKEHKNYKDHHEEVHFHDILTTENVLKTVEPKLTKHKNRNVMNLLQDADKYDRNKMSEDNDKKLMTLLNNLEREVKHLDLGEDEKQIFDAKIKKIYGKVLGKKNDVLTSPDKRNPELKSSNYNDGQDEDDIVHNLPPSYDINDEYFNFFNNDQNYQKKLNTGAETDDRYSRNDINDIEQDKFERPLKKQKSLNFIGRHRYTQRNTNVRQKDPNYLNSLESMRNRYNIKFRRRKTYKNSFRNDLGKLKHRSNSLDYKRNKNVYSNDIYEDILSTEKMRYYQDKLESMERKLQNARLYSRRKDVGNSPQMRALKAPSPRRSDNQMNSLYTGRARILHGY